MQGGHITTSGRGAKGAQAYRAGERIDGFLRLSTALIAAAGLATILSVVLVLQHLRGRAPEALLRDPTSIHGFSPLIGLFSSLGAIAMFCTAAVCLFAASHARRQQDLLRAIGALSMVVAFDDFFMVHDYFVPGLLGVDEIFFLAPLAMAALAVMVVHRCELVGPENAPLWLALGLLAGSVAIDLLVPFSSSAVLVEDGLKFVGLGIWSLYWIRRAHCALR